MKFVIYAEKSLKVIMIARNIINLKTTVVKLVNTEVLHRISEI